MKRVSLFLAITICIVMNGTAQDFWTLMDNGSYKSAYQLAEGVYKSSRQSDKRLEAAYHMSVASAIYQEDARDSAEARYRALLPQLEPLEKALCHAFLGEYDSALVYADVLKATPVEKIKMYCDGGKTQNMTPTAFDVVLMKVLDDYGTAIQRRGELQQMLVDFHAADGDDIRIWHENRLLDYLSNVPNHPLTLERIGEAIEKFRGTKSAYYTLLYERAARWCSNKGDYVAALRYCDTAIQLAPKSQGGVQCANMRSSITAPKISIGRSPHFLIPQREELLSITYSNCSHIYLRVVHEPESYMSTAQLAKLKPLREWAIEVPLHADYTEATACFAMPPLPVGRYRLLASPTKNFSNDMAYEELHVTDMVLRYTRSGKGLLVDRATGEPIVGQRVQLVKPKEYGNKPERVLQTVVTDADGCFRFDSVPLRSSVIRIERGGYNIQQSVYRYSEEAVNTGRTLFNLVSDRPIYRPGDTVRVAFTLYRTDGRDGRLLADGHPFEVVLSDPNGQEVQRMHLVTDDFGSAHCELPLPKDRLAGGWNVTARDSSGSGYMGLRVEEYKQPRFMVTLAADGEAPQFGKECAVQGLAAAYSGMPVGGARVQYTVTRQRLFFRWWSSAPAEVVAEGETTAAADGSFTIAFVPTPDSTVELSTRPSFGYNVQVTVTDLNGESHAAQTTVRVGYRRLFVHLDEVGSTLRELKSVGVRLTDINDTPQKGRVEVAVERLHRPEPMLLTPLALVNNARQLTDSADYRRRFPHYIYNMTENDRTRWATEWRWTGATDSNRLALPPLQGGIYRIVASTIDGNDTVTDTVYTVLTPKGDRLVRDTEVLWADRDGSIAHPGDRYTFRVGTAYEGVRAWYAIEYGDAKQLRSGWLTLGNRIQEVKVDVDSTMLGGFTLTLKAVYHGLTFSKNWRVDVPFDHKKLKVEIATFRDKLLPGEQEEWTIVVRDNSSFLIPHSSLILSMYDDALNSYGEQPWGFSPWRSHSMLSWSLYDPYFSWDSFSGSIWRNYNGSSPSVWTLKDALPYYNRWRGRMMYKTAAARNSAEVEVELDMAVEEESFSATARGESGQALRANDVKEEAIQTAAVGGIGYSDGSAQQEVQVRQNLNTLAFFAPALRTDDGTVTYRFTVPELLTRWNVKGLALTKDLKIGTLYKTLVTQKPLMVQPNMPRFLRSGDSLALMAKVVVNNEELGIRNEEFPVEVFFVLTDAATGDTICNHVEEVKVKDATQVTFPVEVPHNVYVVTYRIVAKAEGMSDGEQGQLPVVTNRQAVTVSQAMYINGAGEKRYSMPEFLAGSDSREPRLVAAEVVSDPIWLAIKCMPYLKNMENPSTLYLANQLYVNTLGKKILDNIKELSDISTFNFQLSTSNTSRLKMNEDVKQTLLQATPWVQDAQSEEEQMAAVKNYFDAGRIDAELQTTATKLASLQNGDGGWSWMPEGKSSLWVTQSVLKRTTASPSRQNSSFLIPHSSLDHALAYIDKEQQRYYDKWIKPYLKKGYKWQPTDIDYLYTRSFYGKATTEAYKFYYDNALKSYKGYENLYTQAQLALIFHRHGDKKAALDLLRRIKEKALTSDEMGMYWRDNTSGWFWYQRPIETQALLIQAFAEIAPQDRDAIGLMQQWLLKQKQTTHWGNDAATTEAIKALTVKNDELRVKSGADAVGLIVFGTEMTAESKGAEGYRSQRWTGTGLDSLITNHSSLVTLHKQSDGIAWGAVYYQFADDMDKIPASEMGIKLKRTYIYDGTLKVGDKVKVRIDIQCDRAMEYLELVDGRPSCVEPLSTRAGWRWMDGLSYYVTVNNTDTRCYIEHIDKGKYYFEYEVYVTNPGHFMAGPVTMQCMYAPEFRAIAPAQTVKVED